MLRASLIVLFLSLTWTPPATAQCEVEGVASLNRLRVRVSGDRVRTLSIVDLPVAVNVGRGNHYRGARILAPLTFSARTDSAIPWSVRHAGSVAEGVLWLTPHARITHVRERADNNVRVHAHLADGVRVERVYLPCEALTVGAGEGGENHPTWNPSGPRWVSRSRALWILSERGDGGAVRLVMDDPETHFLTEIDARDEWIRVAIGFRHTSTALIGWVHRHHIQPAPTTLVPSRPPAREAPPNAFGACTQAPDHGEYLGPALVAAGTQVHMRPDGSAWANVSEPALMTVAWRVGQSWARIVHVNGLRGDGRCPEVLRNAWVPRGAITLQGEGNLADPWMLLGLPQ